MASPRATELSHSGLSVLGFGQDWLRGIQPILVGPGCADPNASPARHAGTMMSFPPLVQHRGSACIAGLSRSFSVWLSVAAPSTQNGAPLAMAITSP